MGWPGREIGAPPDAASHHEQFKRVRAAMFGQWLDRQIGMSKDGDSENLGIPRAGAIASFLSPLTCPVPTLHRITQPQD